MEKKWCYDNKYLLKFLWERLYSTDWMINGQIINGIPKCELQINYMNQIKSEIRLNLIDLIYHDGRKIEEKFL